jgi:hypothetical protein
LPSCGTTVQQYGVRRRRFLFSGTNLILPGRGAPLRFCDTVFPDWCLPGKDIVTPSPCHTQVIPSYTTHKLRGKIPQMARGWERYTLLSQASCLIDTAEMVYAPCIAQRIVSRNWGSSQLAKLRDYSSTVRCPQASVPYFLGTNLILPGRGAPLRFCDTVFRIDKLQETHSYSYLESLSKFLDRWASGLFYLFTTSALE